MRDDFDRGVALLHSDELMSAGPLLERAAALHRHDSEAQLYAAWSRAHGGGPKAKYARRDSIHLARRALFEGHPTSLALLVLGHAALDNGDRREAHALFQRAAAADATLIDARRQLMLLERRSHRPGGAPPRRGRARQFVADVVAKLSRKLTPSARR